MTAKMTQREVRDAFRVLLHPHAKDSPAYFAAAKIFLRKMRHAAGAELDQLAGAGAVAGFNPDPRIEAYQAGKRALYYFMLRTAGLTDEECDRMNTQQETYLE